jgi:LacI family transcriptional regulator, gluconate utilization system Gnt-I transcriptional repressor
MVRATSDMSGPNADLATRRHRARPGRGRVTLQQVAETACVSPATVSRALRQPTLVSSATRQTVQQAIDMLGYIPDLVAGSLASPRTRQIAIVVPSLQTQTFMSMIRGASEALVPNRYQFVLADARLSGNDELQLFSSLLGRRADGLILADVVHSHGVRALLRRSGIPIVETWVLSRHPIDMNVGFDNRAAAAAMTSQLIQSDRRCAGMICGPLDGNERGRQRRQGFLDAVRKAGLRDDLIIELDYPVTLLNSGAALVRLMQRAPSLDAVFCSGDTFAAGALFEAQRQRWPVPGRLAIAGLGDVDLAEATVPAISRALVPGYRIGQLAAEMVVGRLEGRMPKKRSVNVGFELVLRGSTGACP